MKKILSCFLVLTNAINLIAQNQTQIKYVGSSTIANFIKDAEPAYGKIKFRLETDVESAGGEQAILEGRADIGGTAKTPRSDVLAKGVISTLIGWDAIAIIVNENNPVTNLTQGQLKDIFTGKIKNWKEVGGNDQEIHTYITSNESATRKVCRSIILGEDDYQNCETVKPDIDIIEQVKNNAGGLGQISFSFLSNADHIKELAINGQSPSVNNPSYPIKRPLYLLWWPGRTEITDFIAWTQSAEGQNIVKKNFVGISSSIIQQGNHTGTVIVYTQTFAIEDGGIYYYPHRPYEILKPDRTIFIRVPNHISNNDENPSKIQLPAGTYIIRPEMSDGSEKEIFITVESEKVTSVDIEALLKEEKQKETKQPATLPKAKEPLAASAGDMFGKFKFMEPYGDLRIRTEDDITNSTYRFRGRMRVRAGMSFQISPSLKLDLRMASTSNPDDPNSTHINLNEGFDQIQIAIDRANIKWNPQQFKPFTLWLGKFSNPFKTSSVYYELVWDDDIQPEGGAFAFNFKPKGKIKEISIVNGSYLVSQFKTDTKAPLLNASQVSTGIALSSKLSVSLAGGLYYFSNIKGQNVASAVFDGNAGNSTYKKTSVSNGDTSVTEHYNTDFYVNDNFLLIDIKALPLPLRLKGQYIINFGADSNNTGFAAGFNYGKLEDKGNWQIYYQYQEIRQDAIFSPFAQDDVLRQTNFKGHIFGLAYALNKNVSLHGWAMMDQKANDNDGKYNTRLRLDLNIKL